MTPGRRAALAGAVATVLVLGGWVADASAVMSAAEEDESLARDEDYSAGIVALQAGNHTAALLRFQAALKRFPEAANLHNELGFAHRKLGQYEKAFVHYRRALAIDPRHRAAHEYIGEAYLAVDDLAGAERHLKALDEICLLPCDEQRDLRRSIAAHRDRPRAR